MVAKRAPDVRRAGVASPRWAWPSPRSSPTSTFPVTFLVTLPVAAMISWGEPSVSRKNRVPPFRLCAAQFLSIQVAAIRLFDPVDPPRGPA